MTEVIMKADDLVEGDTSAHFKVYSSSSTSRTHTVYLSKGIEESHHYEDLFNTLRTAGPNDKIIFKLACRGGSVSTGQQLIHAIKDCEAHVAMHIDAPCYSMAAILALVGDELKMGPRTFLMFHNASGGFYGKFGELSDQFIHTKQWMYELDEEYCRPFLTDDEIKRQRDDKDVYIRSTDKDLAARIKRHFEKKKK